MNGPFVLMLITFTNKSFSFSKITHGAIVDIIEDKHD